MFTVILRAKKDDIMPRHKKKVYYRDDKYEIARPDPDNVALYKVGDKNPIGYYSNLFNAIHALVIIYRDEKVVAQARANGPFKYLRHLHMSLLEASNAATIFSPCCSKPE